MDFGEFSFDELKKGYRFDDGRNEYVCLYCGKPFQKGQVFPMGEAFYTAESAVEKHIGEVHEGVFSQLLSEDTKYNTLTDNQKQLLAFIHEGLSDREIAKEQGLSEATVRRQRFTFREKAKQARFYLALYETALGGKRESILPTHNKAAYVDDRYLVTQEEEQRILDTSFSSLKPLKLHLFSPKEKKKIVILRRIAKEFESGKIYSEKEVNEILKAIYDDFTSLRRYLIMYGFMKRAEDGTRYWLA